MLSDESQTPLTQTRNAAADVHTPLSTGDVCSGSLGMGLPLASLGVQLCEASLHQLLPGQSASRLQPPDCSHVPLTLHAPLRQTVAPSAIVQGPSVLA